MQGVQPSPAGGQPQAHLSSRQLQDVFPFHVVVDESMRVVQCGRSLAKVLPGIEPGLPLARFLMLVRPVGDMGFASLAMRQATLHLFSAVHSRALLRGQVLRLEGTPASLALLVSPWIDSPESLDQNHLTLGDFALHESTQDLLQVMQLQRIANGDLQALADRLQRHRQDLARANAELHERHERLAEVTRELQEAQAIADVGSWVYDAGTDMLACSPQFLRIAAVREGVREVKPAFLLQRLAPDERERVGLQLKAAVSSRSVIAFEATWQRAPEESRHVSVRGRLEFDAGGRLVRARGTVQDITQRRRYEETLRFQQEQIRKLALVASHTDAGVMIVDPQGRIDWANPAFCRLTGYTQAELRGQRPGRLLQCPETDPATVATMRLARSAGEGYSVEVLNQARDGHRFWNSMVVQPVKDAGGQVLQYISVHRDTTLRRKEQELLARRTAEIDAIFSLSPDGFVAFDAAGGFVKANPAALKLLEMREAEFAGLTLAGFEAVLGSKLAPQSAQPQLVAAADLQQQLTMHGPYARSLAITSRRLQDQGGQGVGSVVHLRDVTEEVANERRRREALAVAAHELRAPLNSVYGYAELLLQGELGERDSREVVETIQGQAGAIVRTVSDLLDLEGLAAGQAVRTRPLRLHPLVRATCEGFYRPDEQRRPTYDPGECGELLAQADESRFNRIVGNLLDNAFKFSREQGGAVHVWLHRRLHAGRRELGVSVRDAGRGIAAADLPRITERFYRAGATSETPGVGLGMALVKESMEAMGGVLEIDSTPGRGTCVTAWFEESRAG